MVAIIPSVAEMVQAAQSGREAFHQAAFDSDNPMSRSQELVNLCSAIAGLGGRSIGIEILLNEVDARILLPTSGPHTVTGLKSAVAPKGQYAMRFYPLDE